LFGNLVLVMISNEILTHKTENSRPSPFFSREKTNLVIVGINLTRPGLISKVWYIKQFYCIVMLCPPLLALELVGVVEI
jgi:hypothetical protein